MSLGADFMILLAGAIAWIPVRSWVTSFLQSSGESRNTGDANLLLSRHIAAKSCPEKMFPNHFWRTSESAVDGALQNALHLSTQAKLDRFGDDLTASRSLNEIQNRVHQVQLRYANQALLLESRYRHGKQRYAAVTQIQLEMTHVFLRHLASLETLPDLPPEIVDALKERALEEFTCHLNELSKSRFREEEI